MAEPQKKPPVRRRYAAELTEERREEIYNAAVLVFAKHGYRDSGIAQIAAAMGVGHGTIYRYFPNKRAIVEYVLNRSIMRLESVVSTEAPNATDTIEQYREQVGRIGRNMFELIVEEPDMASVVFFVSGEIDSELRDQVRAIFDGLATGTEVYLHNGIEKGFLDPGLDTFAMACAINGLIFEGARRVHMAADPRAEGERWIAVAQTLMFDGMGIR